MNLAKSFEKNKIYNLLKQYNDDIYIVGGAIRDILIGKNPENIHDFDIIVENIPAKDFSKKFANENEVTTVITLDEENNIYRIILKDKINYIDVTNPINNSLKEDIYRRDLTINALAFNIKTNEIIDYTDALKDIKNKKIRAISEKNFIDDPLRIIRAYRFASTLGFEIDSETKTMIEKHKNLILMPAVERRNCEIMKLFGGKYTDKVIEEMDKAGIIDIIFPIMLDVKKVPSNTHHHLDLFHHSIETVRNIQEIYETSSKEVQEHLDRIDFGGDTRLAHLKLGGFLHDIGKFSTWTIEDNGRHRFIRHDEIGEQLAKGILKEQKFSKKQIDYIGFIIRNHIYPSAVISAPNITDKIYMRYIRKAQDNSIDLITIAKADRLSARGVAISKEMIANNINGLNKLQEFYLKIKPTLKPLPKLLDGNQIMKIRKMKPSKELGDIIDALMEAQQDGNVRTKEEAIEFVKNYNIA